MDFMPSAIERFNLWREAESLAKESERLVQQARANCSTGQGPGPSELQLRVAEALRKTADKRRREIPLREL